MRVRCRPRVRAWRTRSPRSARQPPQCAGLTGAGVVVVSAWQVASALTLGRLLAPNPPAKLTNTSAHLAGRRLATRCSPASMSSGGRCRLTAYESEQQARAERVRMVALFRYALIREAASPQWSKRDRGEMVRQLAANEHIGPFGEPVRVSRPTIDRWIRAWRRGGFEALLPAVHDVSARTRADVWSWR